MEITITKGRNRNTLTCKRKDGSWTSTNLGPSFPNHDLAHYVVERKFNLKNGFYGKIEVGMSIEELSDKEVIRTLGPEAWLAEILTRNLQSIGSGGTQPTEFIELVQWEAQGFQEMEVPQMTLTDIEEMKADFDQLCQRWDALPENGALTLLF